MIDLVQAYVLVEVEGMEEVPADTLVQLGNHRAGPYWEDNSSWW